MRKIKSKALRRFLQNEERASAILIAVPTAIVVVGRVVSVLAIIFIR